MPCPFYNNCVCAFSKTIIFQSNLSYVYTDTYVKQNSEGIHKFSGIKCSTILHIGLRRKDAGRLLFSGLAPGARSVS